MQSIGDLHKALGDISSIRRQMARTTEFRGYGPATLAATGVLAMLAGAVQAIWLPHPVDHVRAYLCIWMTTAVLSAALIGAQMYERTKRIHSGIANEMIHMAVSQFLPSAGAGALVTIVILRFAAESIWMLPGIWQVIFSLGVFSASRFLPRQIAAAGAWYLLTGLVAIGLADERSLSPWMMAAAYGVGQFLIAAILLRTAKEAGDES